MYDIPDLICSALGTAQEFYESVSESEPHYFRSHRGIDPQREPVRISRSWLRGTFSSSARVRCPRGDPPRRWWFGVRHRRVADLIGLEWVPRFECTLQRDLNESGPHYFRSQRSEPETGLRSARPCGEEVRAKRQGAIRCSCAPAEHDIAKALASTSPVEAPAAASP